MRHGFVDNRFRIKSRDGFGDGDALLERTVRQGMPRRDISQSPYAFHVRAPVHIGQNIATFIQCDAVGCEPVGIGVRHAANGSKHHFAIRGELLTVITLPVVHGSTQVCSGVHMTYRRARHHIHATAFELTRQRHRSPLLPRRQHAVLANEQGHLASRRIPQ